MESINVVIDDTGSPTSTTNEEEKGKSPILDTEPQSQKEGDVQTQEVETAPASQVSQSPKRAQRDTIQMLLSPQVLSSNHQQG